MTDAGGNGTPTVGRLDVEDILASAAAVAGSADLGDEVARTAFAKLVLLADMAARTPAARAEQLDWLRRVAIGRLRFVADAAAHPELADEAIDQPLIVTGIARSGTTLLQALLAEDPASRSPRFWEVRSPSPPPALLGPVERQQRIAEADEELAAMMRASPGGLAARPYLDRGADALTECRAIWEGAPFLHGLLSKDPVYRYRFHRQFLQHLQFGAEPKRWVVKDTSHYYRLPAIEQVYPDALVVWIHRDPAVALASALEMLSIPRAEDPGPVEGGGMDEVRKVRGYLDEVLADPRSGDDAVCHVLYADLVEDPAGTIRGIYERFGLAFTAEHASRIDAWLADRRNRRDRHGRFRYSLAGHGVDETELDRMFAGYRERFRIPREAR